MGTWRGLRFLKRCRSEVWEASFPDSAQRLRIEAHVLDHVRSFRQSSGSAHEAGGQLFGIVTPELVSVSAISGPNRSDERSRYAFRSDPRIAQKQIEKFARDGFVYLGEWHTHAEQQPHPSNSDRAAIQSIINNSRLNTSNLLMLIVGLATPNADLGVWYVGQSGELFSLTRLMGPSVG